MKVSIVIAILDSHEIVYRYVKYLSKLLLPDDIEVIFVDDGSDPPIANYIVDPWFNFKLLETYDKRKWTQGLARMKGIDAAKGEYILCTDLDHIISREAFDFSLDFNGDKAIFRRRFAYLDENGILIRDRFRLIDWGLNPKAIRDDDLSDGVHGNTWLLRRDIFYQLGGYSLPRCNSGSHLQGEDRSFNKKYNVAVREGKVEKQVMGPPIYFFPSGRYHVSGDDNPHGLWHKLEHTKWGQTPENT